jgi:hypothetical protein
MYNAALVFIDRGTRRAINAGLPSFPAEAQTLSAKA